ncbi:MAG: PP2C family protein-serine/threonine phosphatase [Planctomycetota bacterium]
MAEAVRGPSRAEEKLFLAEDLVSTAEFFCAGGQAIVYCAKSPGSEAVNEDAAATINLGPGKGVFAIADGAGGLPAGEEASGLALKHLAASLANIDPEPGSMREAILDGLEQASSAIQNTGVGSATTLVVVAVDGEQMRSYHVGDSAALLVGQKGKVKHFTYAHSPVGYAEASGMINEREAMVHEERHMVSNLVGSSDMKIEIGPLTSIAAKDTLLLASDGLLDNLWFDEIVECIRKGALSTVAKELSARASRRMLNQNGGQPGKPDDLSFILFRRR